MNRLVALQSFLVDFHGRKLSARLSKSEIDSMFDFCDQYEKLSRSEFEESINRMFIGKVRPKNFAIIQEILSCANTRSQRS